MRSTAKTSHTLSCGVPKSTDLLLFADKSPLAAVSLLATFCTGLPIRRRSKKTEREGQDKRARNKERREQRGGEGRKLRSKEKEREREKVSIRVHLAKSARISPELGWHRCILTFFLTPSNVIKPAAGTISLEKALSGNFVASSTGLLPLADIKNRMSNDYSLNGTVAANFGTEARKHGNAFPDTSAAFAFLTL